GVEVPRFCYHERLSVAGNCRMCLVEQEKAPKPIASCAMPVADGMVIKTDSPVVQKARRGVMEFLLINHPLDCPICDQGGECDLQDQAMAYGHGSSRYREMKRAVPDKELGPIVKTEMTRCIQCTRCIRFATEVAGVEVLGATGRGEHMEVGTYVEKTINSELSGNLIDLCPVGALTSKPYAFIARPWELQKVDSVDVMDAVGASIRVDYRGREVLRILPRTNDDVNEEWLADKSRYAVDGLKRQRLDRPYIRVDGKLRPASWPDALDAVAAKLKGLPGSRIAAIAGDMVDAEAMFALKGLMASLRSPNIDCRQDGAALDSRARASWLFNSTINGIEKADAILIVGSNPRWEAPLVNSRIRKRYLKGGLKVAVIGPQLDLTYPYQHLGQTADVLGQIASGAHAFAEALKNAKAPMLILGQGALRGAEGAAVLSLARKAADACNLVREDWNGFNVLQTAAARVGGLEIGFVPQQGGRDVAGILDGAAKGEIEFVHLLGADEIDMAKLGKAFVVYQGHHGDAGAHRADVILPGSAYTEKSGIYVNTEGRPQMTRQATYAPGEAKEDWAILRALSAKLDQPLPYDSLDQLRKALFKAAPNLQKLNAITPAAWETFGADGNVTARAFQMAIGNYYMTDPISRASETMAKCTEAFVAPSTGTGTHG
ncbi:MAG TPA: NADH-quinone oxidoreductase subunit NuoG, partial [Dongiaceae bacterium]|nr:NADH-quinone oxidoreductase subunit NuoG [Dongiaceae bacterium]